MNVLAEQTVLLGGRTYEIRVITTDRHIIAEALDGLETFFEFRVLKQAAHTGPLLSHMQGVVTPIAHELAQAVQGALAHLLAEQDPEIDQGGS